METLGGKVQRVVAEEGRYEAPLNLKVVGGGLDVLGVCPVWVRVLIYGAV